MRPLSIFVRFLSGLFLAALLGSCAAAQSRGPVLLSPASMKESLEAVADAWAAQGNARPVLSFAGSGALARQVERGAPADIIVSADAEWMDWLEARALIVPETRRVLAGNALALIAASPVDAHSSIAGHLRLAGNTRLAIGDPGSVPAGRYARAALQNMGLWHDVQDKIVPTENVRAALALVQAGEAQLGIVYATDAAASDRVYLAAIFDPRDTPEISYPAARLSAAQHPQTGALLEFLSGPVAQEIYAAHGFTPQKAAT
ncbi:molybdate ABC transporter substrate-binding protein [Aurantiacibacter marinus]|uniref:Molybdenum ABC transporter substrate-binding protein n=1 Tax=Aurantiacibacter marinus TaxID=874156 RepID=A0A0H0XR34_9SPHN|nr:molybdate ABC transporter substrate-binding protein [Aurantiacibacter marinus]KLI64387.1 hypothetical protein AAV99_01845 [Aurantiacibacter marinus]